MLLGVRPRRGKGFVPVGGVGSSPHRETAGSAAFVCESVAKFVRATNLSVASSRVFWRSHRAAGGARRAVRARANESQGWEINFSAGKFPNFPTVSRENSPEVGLFFRLINPFQAISGIFRFLGKLRKILGKTSENSGSTWPTLYSNGG